VAHALKERGHEVVFYTAANAKQAVEGEGFRLSPFRDVAWNVVRRTVDELIEERISDRQLDDCDLTLGELKVIADRFRFTLLSMLHSRIAYPKAGHKPATPRDETLRPDVMAATRKPETAPPVSAA